MRSIHLFRGLAIFLLAVATAAPTRSDATTDAIRIQEETWVLPLPLPMFAYVVRPVGNGPFPLVIMNHGVSLNATDRSFFPLVEFRDAAKWFARRGSMVVAPVGSGYGAAAIDIPERALYGPFFSKIGKCTNPNFRDAGLAVAQVDLWIIEYLTTEKRIVPKDVIVVGQSAGGWASIALSSVNPPQVKAIIIFAGGRGGRVGGKPNNNCAPDKLSKRRLILAGRRGCRCCGSISKTIPSSAPICRSECTRPSPRRAARPSIISFRPSATKGISSLAPLMRSRSGHRW